MNSGWRGYRIGPLRIRQRLTSRGFGATKGYLARSARHCTASSGLFMAVYRVTNRSIDSVNRTIPSLGILAYVSSSPNTPRVTVVPHRSIFSGPRRLHRARIGC